MSAKDGQIGGDYLESVGDFVQEPDSHEMEGICEFLNCGVTGGSVLVLAPSHQASVQGHWQ